MPSIQDLLTSWRERTTRRRWLGAVAGTVLVLALGSIAWQLMGQSPSDRTEVQKPRHFHFRCTSCQHEWQADEDSVDEYFGGLPSYTQAVVCPECGDRAAYALTPCPWCGEPYLPEYVVNGGRPSKDICPHCGRDTLKWEAK